MTNDEFLQENKDVTNGESSENNIGGDDDYLWG